MGKKLTKSQKAKKRAKLKQNKIKKMEKEDSLGIYRKKIEYTMNPKVFLILKVISLVAIPVIYFVYSPLLIFAVIFSILMFGFAVMTERKINHTFIKANHIKISKLDSIIAILVLIVTVFSLVMNLNTKKKMPGDFRFMSFKMTLNDFGSCYTGKRGGSFGRNFAPVPPPQGLPSMAHRPMKMEMKDLPVEAVFSVVTSSIQTVLIFLIPATNALTLFIYYKKKKRFNSVMNEVIDATIPDISDEELEKLFLFGYEVDENYVEPVVEETPVEDVTEVVEENTETKEE